MQETKQHLDNFENSWEKETGNEPNNNKEIDTTTSHTVKLPTYSITTEHINGIKHTKQHFHHPDRPNTSHFQLSNSSLQSDHLMQMSLGHKPSQHRHQLRH